MPAGCAVQITERSASLNGSLAQSFDRDSAMDRCFDGGWPASTTLGPWTMCSVEGEAFLTFCVVTYVVYNTCLSASPCVNIWCYIFPHLPLGFTRVFNHQEGQFDMGISVRAFGMSTSRDDRKPKHFWNAVDAVSICGNCMICAFSNVDHILPMIAVWLALQD